MCDLEQVLSESIIKWSEDYCVYRGWDRPWERSTTVDLIHDGTRYVGESSWQSESLYESNRIALTEDFGDIAEFGPGSVSIKFFDDTDLEDVDEYQDRLESLLDALDGLLDYPCYCEQAWSDLEHERIMECIEDSWPLSDAIRDYCKRYDIDSDVFDDMPETLETAIKALIYEYFDGSAENISWDERRVSEGISDLLEGMPTDVPDREISLAETKLVSLRTRLVDRILYQRLESTDDLELVVSELDAILDELQDDDQEYRLMIAQRDFVRRWSK